MHYYIDGYNLALRSRRFGGGSFQCLRQEWIQWLSEESTELGLHMTLVFDSYYVSGTSERGHKAALEVVYTAQGETADEWILAALAEKKRHLKQIVVVTSDKLLAKHARHLGAKTEPVEAFLSWLDKRIVKKKLSVSSEEFSNTLATPPETMLTKVLLKRRAAAPPPAVFVPIEKPLNMTSQEGFSYYLTAFETRWQAQNSADEIRRAAKKGAEQRKKKKSKKQKPSIPNSPVIESDISRWQRLFEQNYRDIFDQ